MRPEVNNAVLGWAVSFFASAAAVSLGVLVATIPVLR